MPTGLRTLDYYAAGPLPRPPAELEVPTVAHWGMLGNTSKGNCGVAGCEHVFMADAAVSGKKETFPDAQECVGYYLQYTGGQDAGVQLATFLLYVRKNGYYGHRVEAFAPVHVNDLQTLRFATFAYGAIYLGIVVTTAMQNTFREQGVWQVATLESTVLGGHCVVGVGYDDVGIDVVTWGGIQKLTYAAWAEMSRYGDTEAFALLTGELDNGDGRNINYATLQRDLNRL
jgi:hypothetical protein